MGTSHEVNARSILTSKMKCVSIVTLFFCFHYTSSQYVSISHKQPKSPCDSSTKNSLIEHFFNIIFTEFHTTPPVCVCVQMCAGQSTYCYPNGCLKKDDLRRVDSPQATPHARGDRKQYMFVVDEKNDFMKDFLQRTYADESMTVRHREQMRDIRPDLFKDKYSMLVKYKKMPSVELRYNLREQVKNMKSDLLKVETVDLSKTRWPMNKRNLVSGHRSHSKIEKRAPLVGKTNFFMTMLPADDVAEYPPKYFKRDVAKTLNVDDANVKTFYLLENSDNPTDSNATETISLETLIDNLINNSFQTKPIDTKNETHTNTLKENKAKKTKVLEERKTSNTNDTVNVISVNFNNEKVDKNKYTEDSVPTTKKFNEMIIKLSKRIEKQNNTSMEIAKRFVGDFDQEDTTLVTNTEKYKGNTGKTNSTLIDFVTEINETGAANKETTATTSADLKETMVTKKNRQRRAKKLLNSKSSSQ